jgi:hypothetical protein
LRGISFKMRDAEFDVSFRDCPAKGGTGGHPSVMAVFREHGDKWYNQASQQQGISWSAEEQTFYGMACITMELVRNTVTIGTFEGEREALRCRLGQEEARSS